jgi:large subunit ribosomal protein L22
MSLAEGTPGARAVLRHSHMSAYKARQVLGLIRGRPVGEALEILRLAERDAAIPIAKLLASAVANAENNEQLDPDELYVSEAYADESVTMKRWRPRARGRATRIRKRTCHVTLVVNRMPEDQIARLSARRAAALAERRQKRVAASRRAQSSQEASSPSSEVESAPQAGSTQVEEQGNAHEDALEGQSHAHEEAPGEGEGAGEGAGEDEGAGEGTVENEVYGAAKDSGEADDEDDKERPA